MNLLCITGNLGKDCAVRYTQGGTAVCSFPVAVKSGYGDKEKTTWVQCVLFGKRAEGGLPPYLIKGAQVCVSGEMNLNEWDKQDGTKGAAVQCVVDKLDLIGGKPQGQQQPAQQPAPQQQAPRQHTQPQGGFGDFEDDVPFMRLGREHF